MGTESDVIQIIKDQLRAREVHLGSNLRDDLGADSLDQVTIIMELEDHFDIEISDDLAAKFVTIQDVVEYVGELVHGGGHD